MQDYETSGAFRRKKDAGDFHMFFSPLMIPSGLTDDEVRICIELYPRKQALERKLEERKKESRREDLRRLFEESYAALERHRDQFAALFGDEYASTMTPEQIADLLSAVSIIEYWPLLVPPELVKSPMTRESFSRGLAAILTRMNELEKSA